MRNERLICAVLAAAFLAAASIAPADVCNSGLQAVAQPTVFPNRSSAAVAWNGSVLAVAKNENNFSKTVWVAIYDAGLVQRSTDRMVAANTDGGTIALLSNGIDFALFYRDLQQHLVLQQVTASGDLTGGPVVIAPGRAVWPNQEFDIAWSAARNGYVILRTVPQGGEKGLYLTTVGPDGSARSDQLLDLFLGNPATPRLAVKGDGGLGLVYDRLVSSTLEGLFFMTIDPANVASSTALVSSAGRNPRLGWNGNDYLLVATTFSAGHGALHSIRLSASGQVIAPDALLVAARGVDVAPLGLVWNATTSEWALGYSDSVLGFNVYPGEYRLLRLTPAAARISDTLFSPDRTKATYGTAYAHIWTGTSYNSSIDHLVSPA
ncbi:MAG TPA: hypothetical protein VEZ11_00745, partial [Thermoanaerobaculia bacterium]|nr:hypothetical protein [Thermoanaerobaculia bacterium]